MGRKTLTQSIDQSTADDFVHYSATNDTKLGVGVGSGACYSLWIGLSVDQKLVE